jgi:high-affinity Fe2+/Pb2+ permease
MLSEKKQKRLNLLRYGMLAVTGVAFALGTSLVFIGSGQLWRAVLSGTVQTAAIALLCLVVYWLYRGYLRKSPEA